MSEPAPEFVAAVAAAASETPGLRVAYLFGSQVTGRTWAESDLDLGVRWNFALDGAARQRAELSLRAGLARRLGRLGERADLVDLDRASSAVAFKAIRDGVCVWKANEAERVDAVLRVARRYDDEAPMRRLFRDAARRVWAG